ncbi:HK97 family phage prohead protease, partial [Cribrihabitans sp. XS_ASV171]
SYVADFLAGFYAGLIIGLSPGFRIPPERTVEDAETVEEEDPEEGTALIRTVHHALLYEVSAVTRPAYDETQLEARNWGPVAASNDPALVRSLQRWRL